MRKFLPIFLFCLICFPTQAADEDIALSYMSYLSSKIVQRPLNASEINSINLNGTKALKDIVLAWSREPGFLNAAESYIHVLLSSSGTKDGVNYDLPGYLGRDIARRNRPYSDLITAESCVDKAGNNVNCDTGAPYTAGVLTTKAYMATNKGAYNIHRAGVLTHTFLCATYPFPETEEPKLKESDLIPQFATTSGAVTFGNGNNCYSCHSQFGHHAQFFVKFNLNGSYIASADGLQQPGATDGFSANSLATSHLSNPSKAASESSQILGQPAANLREAALVVAKSPRFLPCAVKNLMRHYLRLSDQSVDSIKPDLFQQIALQARSVNKEPSLADLLSAIIASPYVFQSFKESGARP